MKEIDVGRLIPGEVLVLEIDGKCFIICFMILATICRSCFHLLPFL